VYKQTKKLSLEKKKVNKPFINQIKRGKLTKIEKVRKEKK
jgi:hypothetical protein